MTGETLIGPDLPRDDGRTGLSAEALAKALQHNLFDVLGHFLDTVTPIDRYQALALSVRDSSRSRHRLVCLRGS